MERAILLRTGGAVFTGRWDGSSYAPATAPSLRPDGPFGVSVARAEIGAGDRFGVAFMTFRPSGSSGGTGEVPFSVLYPECANREDDDKDGLVA